MWAWKAGIDWAINDSSGCAGTRSRDVRAASLEERFDTTRGGVTVNNPYVLTRQPTTQSGASYSGGNPNLAPEKADTWTAGFVFTPSFLQGFSASVDWYKITIADAIDKPTPQQIVDAAFARRPAVSGAGQARCRQQHRRGRPVLHQLRAAVRRGRGLRGRYRHSVHLFGGGPEDIAFRLYATDLIKNATLTQFGTYDEWAGQVGTARSLPKHKYTANVTYNNGPYSLFVQGRYISKGILDHTLIQSAVAIRAAVQTDQRQHDRRDLLHGPEPHVHGAGAGRSEGLRRGAEPARPRAADDTAAYGRTGAMRSTRSCTTSSGVATRWECVTSSNA